MQSISSRLQNAEDQLLSAFTAGPTALIAFEKDWLQLQTEVEISYNTSLLDNDTLYLAHATASNIVLIADLFLDNQKRSEQLTAQIGDELDALFSQISLTESPPSSTPTKPSHSWLLQNLHNPYPSTEVRERLAAKMCRMRRDIDAWFIDARKRIGWTSLRNTCFDKKRAGIVDAATRFFVRGDPQRPLEPHLEVAFASIQSTALELYSERFLETNFATELGAAAKDMTPSLKIKAKTQAEVQRMDSGELLSAPLNPVVNLLEIRVETQRGHKRRGSADSTVAKNVKRARSDNVCCETVATSLPAIPIPDRLDFGGKTGPVMSTSLSTLSTKRKRRLSESDTSPGPKRPCHLPVGIRSNAVSNPFPIPMTAEAAVDEWLKLGAGSFDFPGVTIDEPGPFEPLDIALFDFSTILPTHSYPPSPGESSSSTPTTPEQFLQDVNADVLLQNIAQVAVVDPHMPERMAGADDPCYISHVFASAELEQDDFSFADYSGALLCSHANSALQASPLSGFNLLQPESTAFASDTSVWDWLTPEVPVMNSHRQTSPQGPQSIVV